MSTIDNTDPITLIHGGQVNKMAELHQIPVAQWVDLSTGISPLSYPIPDIPLEIWQQLPQPSETLLAAAKKYYGTQSISVTNGSQAVIARLPTLFRQYVQGNVSKIEVWLPKVGYKEHEKSWRDAGFYIKQYEQLPICEELTKHAIVVVINPNNPTGELHQQQTLITLLNTIKALSGWLILDEAFMDIIEPSQSIIHLTENKNLFVLRSIGKFFGLAGIRIGFLSANMHWLEKLQQISSPWEVNGPAQFITEQALNNSDWQIEQQKNLSQLSEKLEQMLKKYLIRNEKNIKNENKNTSQRITITGCSLFKTLIHPQAAELHQLFCRQGLYVRLCDEKNALRFGIPSQKQSITLEKLLAQHCHG